MKRIFLLLLLTPSLFANQFMNPWFSPLWEFESEMGYRYTEGKRVESPTGDFNVASVNHSVHMDLGLTFWPYWNGFVELRLTRTTQIPFAYEAALATLRYQWLDDIQGDLFALATGVTFSFPSSRYLHSFYFPYHGEVNGQLFATLGKEWARGCDWWMRGWILGGWGIANRGQSWLHSLATLEFRAHPFEWGFLAEGVMGMGPHNLTPTSHFKGYASVAHRSLDFGGFIRTELGYLGKCLIRGWYNVYAHNFVLHSWNLEASLEIPFSF